VKAPEDIEAEIWQHALDLAEPGGLGRLVEADAVVQASGWRAMWLPCSTN